MYICSRNIIKDSRSHRVVGVVQDEGRNSGWTADGSQVSGWQFGGERGRDRRDGKMAAKKFPCFNTKLKFRCLLVYCS